MKPSMTVLPNFCAVHRFSETVHAVDVEPCVIEQVRKLLAHTKFKNGQSVAVAVGSRGITELPQVVFTIIQELKQQHLKPFLVPAMGSHGGGTSAGQCDVLNSLGISAKKMSVEIKSGIETEQLGKTADGTPIHFSKQALAADHVLICNRIKPHTHFAGSVQSGLQKMLTIGLGKAIGAETYHRACFEFPLERIIHQSVDLIAAHTSILGGIALLENSCKKLSHIEAILQSDFATREAELLKTAEALMPRLPLKEIDLLIIDEIGKEISGTGFDTNIVGRKHNDHISDDRDWCKTRFIHVRSLTDQTAGNANGIGIAEFCTQNVIEQTDWEKTTLNAITASHPTAAMRPIVFPNDREVMEAVFNMLGNNAKIVQIKNTLELETLHVSESCLKKILKQEPNINITPPCPVHFTSQGNLHDVST